LVVETVAKLRRDHDRGKPIKAIARETGLSRSTVRKAVRAESAQFSYFRSAQPRLELGGFAGRLEEFLEANERAGKQDRIRLTPIHDLLQREVFGGSYDAVRRYAKRWKRERQTIKGEGFSRRPIDRFGKLEMAKRTTSFCNLANQDRARKVR
jgi:predicted transcriptional regulator